MIKTWQPSEIFCMALRCTLLYNWAPAWGFREPGEWGAKPPGSREQSGKKSREQGAGELMRELQIVALFNFLLTSGPVHVATPVLKPWEIHLKHLRSLLKVHREGPNSKRGAKCLDILSVDNYLHLTDADGSKMGFRNLEIVFLSCYVCGKLMINLHASCSLKKT